MAHGYKLDIYPRSVEDMATHNMSYQSALLLCHDRQQACRAVRKWTEQGVPHVYGLHRDDSPARTRRKITGIMDLIKANVPVQVATDIPAEGLAGLRITHVTGMLASVEELKPAAGLRTRKKLPVEVFIDKDAIPEWLPFRTMSAVHGTLANAGFDMESAEGIGMYAVQIEALAGR